MLLNTSSHKGLKKQMKKIIIIVIMLCCLTNGYSSVLLDFTHYNSRLYGTGESLLVERGDFNNIDIFPASIAELDGQTLGMGYIKWIDLLNIMRAGYAHNLGDMGVIGGTVNFVSLNDAENHDKCGNLLGDLKYKDVLVNIGYGRKMKKNIQLGMNVKYLNLDLNGYNGNWIGAGVSGLMSFNLKGINIEQCENFNVGLGIQDVNLLKAKFDKDSTVYPMKVHAGFVYKFLKIAEIETKIGTTYSFVTKYNRHYVSTGLELCYNELLYLRSGYYISGRYSDKIAIGLGIGKDDLLRTKLLGKTGIKFDYSLSLLKDGTGHFVQLCFMFLPVSKEEKEREKEKQAKEEKYKEYYFEGLDAFIKEGYGKAGIEWEKALKIKPENQDLKNKIKEAREKQKIKNQGIIIQDKKEQMTVTIKMLKKKVEGKGKKIDNIVVVVLNYQNAGGSNKWEFLKGAIPDSINSSLNNKKFIKVIKKNVLKDFLDKLKIKRNKMYAKQTLQTISKDLKANIVIKGSFKETNRKLQIKTEIWDLETKADIAVIRVTGEVGADMFELMDKIVEAIVKVFESYK